ncbi:CDP-alcohol phosphatidyltransferase family protein [Frigoriflavimonas asaccharolytica]|uniref:CDP-diacylglycerol--glycerol-3-phosphate 3-phosphatidyltransferase n=1 Tax=Frigoriflavimonas asaccharolytica TaxID=2735899 RepID=A0A8J8G901_9FLAO|nr:CDP-alcohol phosphatidyltransferase family protein [Frigoriflavimonas asaccharolytica]NRS93323.1 CDP-diacylglycerol--glycerol-3-phosphate 3-phosphatidyltransferase [Frigoriflavimonas asaccharolytica]
MKKIPLSLIIFRFLLAPIILFLAYYLGEESRIIILVLMYLGLISDIFDGIIARKAGVSSEKLRRLDSQTDLIFWVSIGVATYILFPILIVENKFAIISIFAMEALCYIISFAKFGKETCTHAFLSKMWGLSLLVAFTSLLSFEYAGIPFYIAVVLGLIAHLDVIFIILILPKWQHDIPSSYHAWQIKKGVKIKRSKFLNG